MDPSFLVRFFYLRKVLYLCFFIWDPLGIISEYCASLLFLWCLNRLPARELLSRRLIPTKEPVHGL